MASYRHFGVALVSISNMPQSTDVEPIEKYAEMNAALPFERGKDEVQEPGLIPC